MECEIIEDKLIILPETSTELYAINHFLKEEGSTLVVEVDTERVEDRGHDRD